MVNMKTYLMIHFYQVISNGRIFSHIQKMRIKTISNKSYVKCESYLNQPMQMIERRLNMIIAKNLQLINSLNRSSDHPLFRKFIHNPFKDY